MNNHFRIGVRTKMMSLAFELVAQLGKVVDLPVVGDPNRSIFVRHRHMTIRRGIENGEASASQTNVATVRKTPLPQPGVIRTAMSLHVRHPSERICITPIGEATDSAHRSVPPHLQLVDFRLRVKHLHRLKRAINKAGNTVEKPETKHIAIKKEQYRGAREAI